MMSKNDGGPAFPRPQAETSIGGNTEQDGMSLRDYFAAQALAGLTANTNMTEKFNSYELADGAFQYADAMLAERNKDNG